MWGPSDRPRACSSPVGTYSRTNKVVAWPPEPAWRRRLRRAAAAADPASTSAGISDNIHISLLPQKPIGSHFAFALENKTQKSISSSVEMKRGVRGGAGRGWCDVGLIQIHLQLCEWSEQKTPQGWRCNFWVYTKILVRMTHKTNLLMSIKHSKLMKSRR